MDIPWWVISNRLISNIIRSILISVYQPPPYEWDILTYGVKQKSIKSDQIRPSKAEGRSAFITLKSLSALIYTTYTLIPWRILRAKKTAEKTFLRWRFNITSIYIMIIPTPMIRPKNWLNWFALSLLFMRCHDVMSWFAGTLFQQKKHC